MTDETAKAQGKELARQYNEVCLFCKFIDKQYQDEVAELYDVSIKSSCDPTTGKPNGISRPTEKLAIQIEEMRTKASERLSKKLANYEARKFEIERIVGHADLTAREYKIFYKRYGGYPLEEKKLEELAEEIGWSRETVVKDNKMLLIKIGNIL